MRPAASKYSVTTLDPGAKLGLTLGEIERPNCLAFRASKPAAIITLGLLVFVQLVIAAITISPCFRLTPLVGTSAEDSFILASIPCPL